ncbi:MAG: DUF6338 family protein [Porticoccaceae bacterium]
MDIWDTNKLALFIAFVVPGFISLKTYELLFPAASKDTTQQLIDAVAYSSINYALLLLPIYEVEAHALRTSHPHIYVAFYVFVLLFAPVLWVLLLSRLRSTQCIQNALPHPIGKPWDYIFAQRKRFWVVVLVKDGMRFGGLFDSKSFASSAPNPEQIYLQESWKLNGDGGFERVRIDSAGILILTSEIVSIEFFKVLEGDEDDRQQAN